MASALVQIVRGALSKWREYTFERARESHVVEKSRNTNAIEIADGVYFRSTMNLATSALPLASFSDPNLPGP